MAERPEAPEPARPRPAGRSEVSRSRGFRRGRRFSSADLPRPPGSPRVPPTSRPDARFWFVAVSVAVVVFGTGAVLLGLVVWNHAKAPADAAERWLAAAQVGDLSAADAQTCADSSTEELISYLERLAGMPIVDFTVDNANSSGRSATVEGTITGAYGAVSISLSLVNEDGWKVCEAI